MTVFTTNESPTNESPTNESPTDEPGNSTPPVAEPGAHTQVVAQAAPAPEPPAWDRGSAPYPPPPPGPYYPHPAGYSPGYAPQGYAPQGYPPPPAYPPPGYGSAGWPHAVPMTAPKAWPVAVFTLLFGIFGAISAARRQSAANEIGVSGRRYWWTFGGTLVASAAIWIVSVAAVIFFLASFSDSTSTSTSGSTDGTVMTVSQLENEIQASSASGVAVSTASCFGQNTYTDGTGTYVCGVTFVDGDYRMYTVTVAEDGTWTTD